MHFTAYSIVYTLSCHSCSTVVRVWTNIGDKIAHVFSWVLLQFSSRYLDLYSRAVSARLFCLTLPLGLWVCRRSHTVPFSQIFSKALEAHYCLMNLHFWWGFVLCLYQTSYCSKVLMIARWLALNTGRRSRVWSAYQKYRWCPMSFNYRSTTRVLEICMLHGRNLLEWKAERKLAKAESFFRTMLRFAFSLADNKHYKYPIYKHWKFNKNPEIERMTCYRFLSFTEFRIFVISIF